ncbi:MAG: bifunctional folylpolyglutamate synthase/dihydrofolate synthase [Candidatus Kapabacteria bacterium]|nr:bifunctional folylpolyglutamate synthase/dihydrofolate synthase [Ignavibacteriota bacterium]MCW5883969.1 bifunctional folylpolyglutamate synthase/dihydrofolate synthase [Candidatus Kapabacteria bacterium]
MSENIISIDSVLYDLFAKQRFGIKPGLERTLALCNSQNSPQNKFRSIHIAGTNGKGSVCSSIAAILMDAGYKTGLYTSPHLLDFNERIRINDTLISNSEIVEYYHKLKGTAEIIGATFFEITTVMAFMHFAEKAVDIAVIETGMGGRFDSTNVVYPLVSVITKIDLDHQEYLGDTIEKIAKEKAGIIKPGIPCVLARNNDRVNNVVNRHCPESVLIEADKYIQIKNIISKNILVSNFSVKYPDGKLLETDFGLSGKAQKDNLKTVLSAIDIIRQNYKINDLNIQNGLKNVRSLAGLKARIDVLSNSPLIILDGSHNDNSIENLFNTLEQYFPDKKWNIICNFMADKNFEILNQYLKKYALSVHIPDLKIQRAMKSYDLANKFKSFGISNIKTYTDVNNALTATADLDNILIFGSFYLVGEVLENININ